MNRAQKSPTLTVVQRESVSLADIEPIIDAAKHRAALVSEMKTAFESGDEQRAFTLARKVCGLTTGEGPKVA